MYAVVKTGGKQYRVAVGDKLKVESLDAQEGDNVILDHVLMIGDGDSVEVGTPTLDKTVEATVLSNGRGKKLRIVKFRRRQNSRTRTGHRQNYTELEITAIGGKAAAPKKAAAVKKAAAPKKAASSKETVVKKTATPKKEAKALMTYAFANNVLESVKLSSLKKRINKQIANKLGVSLGFEL